MCAFRDSYVIGAARSPWRVAVIRIRAVRAVGCYVRYGIASTSRWLVRRLGAFLPSVVRAECVSLASSGVSQGTPRALLP